MTTPPFQTGEILTKFFGYAVRVPRNLWRFVAAATLSVSENLLELLHVGVVCDVGRMKEAILSSIEAEAAERTASAQLKLAEAAKAANDATLHKRRDAIAVLERRKLQADITKTEAERDAIEKDAETRRFQAIAEAQSRLLEAISKLRQEGGDLFLSQENLEGILRLGLPPVDQEEGETE